MDLNQIVQKADVALSDLTTGGKLTVEQFNQFYRKVIEAPTILPAVRYLQMARPSVEINKIGFSQRVLRPANQGTISSPRSGEEGTRALARADRTKPELSKITLNTEELIAEIDIPYEVLEDNIEGENMYDTVLAMIGQAAARDLEEKLILGDTSSADTYLALHNGLLAEAASNIYNYNNSAIGMDLFENMINALPVRYHPFLSEMNFFVSTTREVNMRAQLSKRQTSLGDQLTNAAVAVSPLGVPLRGATKMPNDKALLVNPRNIIWGLQRDIRIEFDKDIRERAYIVVLTMRVAHKYEEEDMVVKALNVGN